VLGSYFDAQGCPREVLSQPGAGGSLLVVDRDASTYGDRRLVAHLGADEPLANAALVCRDYLCRSPQRCCRRVTAEDLRLVPFLEHDPHGQISMEAFAANLQDSQGRAYRLLPAATGMSIPELRWHRLSQEDAGRTPQLAGLREVVAALESYEPARSLTTLSLRRHRDDPRVSTYALGAELERLDASRIVLNRGLREAVQAAVASGASMSEITIRCGRFKRGSGGGGAGGDTSWLARRIGLMSEGGKNGAPTPWVHSEVLALIARRGLGISPREVEL
jgi:hypothetical protein